jgi:hypothetical protein
LSAENAVGRKGGGTIASTVGSRSAGIPPLRELCLEVDTKAFPRYDTDQPAPRGDKPRRRPLAAKQKHRAGRELAASQKVVSPACCRIALKRDRLHQECLHAHLESCERNHRVMAEPRVSLCHDRVTLAPPL